MQPILSSRGRDFPWARGFTTLELLCALMMLGILAALAFPAFSNWMPTYRLKAATQDLFSNLQLAKATAIEKGCNCAICFGQALGSMVYDYVIFVDSDNDLEYDPGEQILIRRSWTKDNFPGVSFDPSKGGGDGLTFLKNDDGVPAIAFQASGIPINNTGGLGMGTAFLINTKGKGNKVVISSSGNIRIK
ncbi:MAG: GspH/FimT family pseudopilin [Deltaproteobacteria bacterium]|nr:GspH/FimT family pseudopilin [Deltaproteobacteria bacterium]MBW1927613.1 GspH/FimT family pseudopilin [Deltaproteobacteria bacterium]MBW2024597.1 GspH/FimT family pseudopilin [Deltaproteobacteria bacterium]MBW2127031.1 GspH/FimT family pseudopilin [Deltaproteobacteria bacterium]RLB23953.1 MAG: hypothetical protein DRG76_02800 [Deltaproteobacteria bacterium]